MNLQVLCVVLLSACAAKAPERPILTVAAAASLREVFPALLRDYAGTYDVRVTYGASGDLRKQVEGGAPVDLVVFAAADPVDKLVAKRLVDPGSRRVVARNRLVLIGPRGEPALTFLELAELPPGERIAIGEPGAVPAGKYARDLLTEMGVWERLAGRVVFGGDVGAVLNYARRGEVRAAIVYQTEVRHIEDVTTYEVATGPTPEIVAGVVVGPRATEATRLLHFLLGDGQDILAEHGFLRAELAVVR